jgi:hypothetical protein
VADPALVSAGIQSGLLNLKGKFVRAVVRVEDLAEAACVSTIIGTSRVRLMYYDYSRGFKSLYRYLCLTDLHPEVLTGLVLICRGDTVRLRE